MWSNHHHNNEWRYKLTKNTSQIMAATKHFLCGEVTDTSCMTTIIVSSSFSFTISRYPHRIMHFLPSHLYFWNRQVNFWHFSPWKFEPSVRTWAFWHILSKKLATVSVAEGRGGVWGGVVVCAHCSWHRCGHCIVQCTCALYVLCIACTWHRCGQSLWIFLNVHTVAP